jgi:hypothetical protein
LVAADLSFISLYRENASSPTTPSATGTNAIAVGSGSAASATNGFAQGDGSSAYLQGGKNYAHGKFATAGDAQTGVYIVRNVTSTATPTDLFLDGTGATQRIVLPSNSVYTFDILVTARRTDAAGGAAGYRFVGVISKDTTAGSAVIIGSVSKTIMAETNTPWDVTVTADTSNGALKITATGEAAKTIRWVAVVNTVEVTN